MIRSGDLLVAAACIGALIAFAVVYLLATFA